MKQMVALAAIAVLIAGCSSAPTTESGAPVQEGASQSGATSATVNDRGAVGDALTDPNNPQYKALQARSIYFDFDSDAIKSEYTPVVEAHARYLRDNANRKVLIQGNTDERGSREYNIGLGQRRADAVKSRLTLLGAKDSQVEATSLGEEKPRCTEATESCWSQNRRGDLVY